MRPIEAERIIKADGWVLDRQRGSHRIYVHPTKPGRVIIPWHNRDLATGTMHSIFDQAIIRYP